MNQMTTRSRQTDLEVSDRTDVGRLAKKHDATASHMMHDALRIITR
jgi:hypothetical protein